VPCSRGGQFPDAATSIGSGKRHGCAIGGATIRLLIDETHPHRRGWIDLVGNRCEWGSARGIPKICELARQSWLHKVQTRGREVEEPVEGGRSDTAPVQAVAAIDPGRDIENIRQRIAS